MKYETTTLNTKKMLSESLKKLLEKKSFTHITVREITESCKLNRNTFYYHFEDVNDLLKWTLEQEAINIVKNFDLMLDYEEALGFALNYIKGNDKMLGNICNSIGRNELKRFFCNDFHEITASFINKAEQQANLSVPDSFKEFLCQFYTEALAGMILEAIINPALRDSQTLIPYTSGIIKNSLPHILSAYDTKSHSESQNFKSNTPQRIFPNYID